MKCIIKEKSLGIYRIDDDYKKYLFKYDNKVSLKPERKYSGIIVGIENYEYFIPFTSKPLRNNGKRRNPQTTVEIYNESHKLIAALLINNMIPVPSSCYSKVIFNKEKDSDFLRTEYIYLKKTATRKEIERKTTKVINRVLIDKDPFLTKFCCRFGYLQELCDNWQ